MYEKNHMQNCSLTQKFNVHSRKEEESKQRHKKKTPRLDNRFHPIRTTSLGLAQQWGGLYIKWHERREFTIVNCIQESYTSILKYVYEMET